MVCIFYWGF